MKKRNIFKIASIALFLSILVSCGAEVTPHSYETTGESEGYTAETRETEEQEPIVASTEESLPEILSTPLYSVEEPVNITDNITFPDDAANEINIKYANLDYDVIHCQVGSFYVHTEAGLHFFLYDFQEDKNFFVERDIYHNSSEYHMYTSHEDIKGFVDYYTKPMYPTWNDINIEYTSPEHPKSALEVYKEILADEDFFDKYVLVRLLYANHKSYEVLRTAKNASDIDTDLKILVSTSYYNSDDDANVYMKRLFYTFIILPKEAYTGERSKDGHYFVYNTDNDYIYHSGEKYGLEDFLYDRVNIYDPEK